MRTLCFYAMIATTAFVPLALHAQEESSIIFQVVNIKQKTGYLVVRLYNTVADFNQKTEYFYKEKKVRLNTYSPRAIFVYFDSLAIDKYAAYAFVDNNENNQVDFNRYKETQEQFTFSRREGYNLKRWDFDATFDDTYFEYHGQEIRMMLKVEK